jgi:hypothetical protein
MNLAGQLNSPRLNLGIRGLRVAHDLGDGNVVLARP